MNAIAPIVAAEPAPDLETSVWSGRPDWRSAVVHVWKVGWVAAYFALLLADGARIALWASHDPAQAWTGELRLLAAAAIVLTGLTVMAALTARTTRYSIEARTLTLRYGVALPARLVIPFSAIEAVGARVHGDGAGDVSLRLKPGQAVLYPKLWPHARPWRWRRAEPMLRCVPDAGLAAAILCRRLAEAGPTTPTG